MKTVLEQKAETLLTLLENANLNNLQGLTEITFSIPDDLVPPGQNIKEWNIRNRVGLSDSRNQLQHGYCHFFFFVDKLSIYFSKDIIYIRVDNEEEDDERDDVYHSDFGEFIDNYFQLSTKDDLLLSKEFYERLFKFAKEFNWVHKDERQ